MNNSVWYRVFCVCGLQIVFGGDVDADELYVAPTLIDNVSLESKIMQEEIFGE